MGLQVDFSRLDAQDVLDLAIQVEEEAQDNYEQLSSWMASDGNNDAAEFFKRMASFERRHRDQLTARRDEIFGDAPPRHSERAVWEVEQPDYGAIGRAVTLEEAIDFAMDAERRAGEYYAAALEYISEETVATLFEELRQAETDHLRMLEKQRTRMTEQ